MRTKRKGNRIRLNVKQPNIGLMRNDYYKCAILRCTEAINAGFYVEAIALTDSLITDRLESFLNEHKPGDLYAFDNLGTLIHDFSSIAPEEFSELIENIDLWKNKRNLSIHELAKIDSSKYVPFSEKYKETQKYAEEGLSLFRKLDNAIRKYRRNKHKLSSTSKANNYYQKAERQ